MIFAEPVWSPVTDITVTGVPVAQGSMSGFQAGGRVIITDQKGKRLKPWRTVISDAILADPNHAGPDNSPYRVQIWFAVPKPTSTPKRRRTWPTRTRGTDIDKMARAVLDAITQSRLWFDDCQAVSLIVDKDWPGTPGFPDQPGARILISRMMIV